jgi:hypothetical protein
MQIRQATLDDTQAISKLFCAGIERWQRMDAQGRVEDLPYEQLTIYERWLHGGAWLSLETAALWLSHLLRGAGSPFVLEDVSGAIIGYVETYSGDEPAPYGYHLHIGRMVTQANSDSQKDALMQFLLEQAGGIGRITASSIAYDADTINFYKRYGMSVIETIQHVTIPTTGGSVAFYKVTDHPKADVAQIANWTMPIGRTENSRYHWEHQWANLWQAVPQITARTTHRQHFNAAGQEALVCSQQHLYNPRSADIHCWTAKPLTAQVVNAVRDWAHKQGYRTLTLAVTDNILPLLGANIEKTPVQHTILARDV